MKLTFPPAGGVNPNRAIAERSFSPGNTAGRSSSQYSGVRPINPGSANPTRASPTVTLTGSGNGQSSRTRDATTIVRCRDWGRPENLALGRTTVPPYPASHNRRTTVSRNGLPYDSIAGTLSLRTTVGRTTSTSPTTSSQHPNLGPTDQCRPNDRPPLDENGAQGGLAYRRAGGSFRNRSTGHWVFGFHCRTAGRLCFTVRSHVAAPSRWDPTQREATVLKAAFPWPPPRQNWTGPGRSASPPPPPTEAATHAVR